MKKVSSTQSRPRSSSLGFNFRLTTSSWTNIFPWLHLGRAVARGRLVQGLDLTFRLWIGRLFFFPFYSLALAGDKRGTG
ncbi:hypothetical protein LY76DRAFT_381581 [Colletotrichum caudatum]|nr:hypothetical protein LY76DRAFT_381581 [Colletotrichum caudatum]